VSPAVSIRNVRFDRHVLRCERGRPTARVVLSATVTSNVSASRVFVVFTVSDAVGHTVRRFRVGPLTLQAHESMRVSAPWNVPVCSLHGAYYVTVAVQDDHGNVLGTQRRRRPVNTLTILVTPPVVVRQQAPPAATPTQAPVTTDTAMPTTVATDTAVPATVSTTSTPAVAPVRSTATPAATTSPTMPVAASPTTPPSQPTATPTTPPSSAATSTPTPTQAPPPSPTQAPPPINSLPRTGRFADMPLRVAGQRAGYATAWFLVLSVILALALMGGTVLTSARRKNARRGDVKGGQA